MFDDGGSSESSVKTHFKGMLKMETLHKNHPRFCAQYIKQVGVAKEERIGWCRALKLDDKFYIYQHLTTQHKVGDTVLIAKRIAQPGREWMLHEIKLGEDYWTYQYFMNKTAKEQRTNPYQARTQGWWSSDTFIVEQASMEYIKRQFRY